MESKFTPNAAQLYALQVFAEANGRTWKAALRRCWDTGNYGTWGTPLTATAPAYLQQCRNNGGSNWLLRFKLPPAKVDRRHANPGRPPAYGATMRQYSLALTDAQRAEVDKRGGWDAVRRWLDAA